MSSRFVERARRYNEPKISAMGAICLLGTFVALADGDLGFVVIGALGVALCARMLYVNERRWRDTSGGGER